MKMSQAASLVQQVQEPHIWIELCEFKYTHGWGCRAGLSWGTEYGAAGLRSSEAALKRRSAESGVESEECCSRRGSAEARTGQSETTGAE